MCQVGVAEEWQSSDGGVQMLEFSIIEGGIGLENMVVESQSLEFNG